MEFFTTAAGITVHVEDTRNDKGQAGIPEAEGKPCLVLLHGYLETMYVFNELVEALKGSFRIISLDMPGHGLTDSAPADEEGRRINSLEFQARVVAGVLDKCGVGKAVIAGHSMGGYVCLQFIRDYPERAERAILLNSHPYPDAPEKSKDREREKNLISEGKLMALASFSIPKMYYEENLRSCDEKIRETVELCETHDPEGIKSSIDGLRTRPDNSSVMERPPVPLTLVYGDYDEFLPLESVAVMKERFPLVNYVLVPETGHNSFIEKTEQAAEAITRENC